MYSLAGFPPWRSVEFQIIRAILANPTGRHYRVGDTGAFISF
jgi:hypothetical protein